MMIFLGPLCLCSQNFVVEIDILYVKAHTKGGLEAATHPTLGTHGGL